MRAMTLGLSLLALSFVPLAPARAQECADQTQMGLDQCASAAYKKTDAKLNAVYRQIVARLAGDADTKARLVTAQKAWIAFRDAECKFRAGNAEGGSIYPMLVIQCRDALEQKRIEELSAQLECEEGDLSCPVPAAP